MNKKQTAVEWLVEQLTYKSGGKILNSWQEDVDLTKFIEQANRMFEEQIKNTWITASKTLMLKPLDDKYYKPEAEQYYNETYGKEN